MRACGPAHADHRLTRADRGPMRAEPARAYAGRARTDLQTHYLGSPVFFLRVGPADQALITIPMTASDLTALPFNIFLRTKLNLLLLEVKWNNV